MAFINWWKKHCASLKEKTFSEEFLGSLACAPEHDSEIFLTFSPLKPKDSYKKKSYKKNSV